MSFAHKYLGFIFWTVITSEGHFWNWKDVSHRLLESFQPQPAPGPNRMYIGDSDPRLGSEKGALNVTVDKKLLLNSASSTLQPGYRSKLEVTTTLEFGRKMLTVEIDHRTIQSRGPTLEFRQPMAQQSPFGGVVTCSRWFSSSACTSFNSHRSKKSNDRKVYVVCVKTAKRQNSFCRLCKKSQTTWIFPSFAETYPGKKSQTTERFLSFTEMYPGKKSQTTERFLSFAKTCLHKKPKRRQNSCRLCKKT